MKLHGRDYAVDLLNKWFDEIGVLPEQRIKVDDEDLEEGEEVKVDDEDLEEGEEVKEEYDRNRERVITAIRRNMLTINEKKELVLTLETPIKTEKGETRLDSLVFKRRYKQKEFRNNARGLSEKDMFSFYDAKIAARCGVSRTMIGELYDVDYDICQSVIDLFTRTGYSSN